MQDIIDKLMLMDTDNDDQTPSEYLDALERDAGFDGEALINIFLMGSVLILSCFNATLASTTVLSLQLYR